MFDRFCLQREQLGARWWLQRAGGQTAAEAAAAGYRTSEFEILVTQVDQRLGNGGHRRTAWGATEIDGSSCRHNGGGGGNSQPGASAPASVVEATTGSTGSGSGGGGREATSPSSPAIGHDDELSAAELRRKNAGAVDLWLASGMVSFFRVEARSIIRAGCAKDSAEVGVLEVGEIIKVVERRKVGKQQRVRFERGWASLQTAHGQRLLTELEL
eukprot:COSAG05_NODE_2_length_63105_cov_159.292956_23_plen_214_part_00